MKYLSIPIILFGFFIFQHVHAGEVFSVSPAIIDLKAKTRERIEKQITLKNHAQRKINVYARILDIETENGKETFHEPSDSDKTASLANWTSVSGGAVELLPEEEKSIPLIVEINPRAKTGIYHARISFGEGATRGLAESGGGEGVLLNMEVWEEKIERVALKYFRPEKEIFWEPPISFLYALQNMGTEEIQPKGEIVLYDKKGAEIGALNLDIPLLLPGKIHEAARRWESGHLLGNGKAILVVSYGEGNPKTIEDTVFFQVIPWQVGAASLLGAGVLVCILKIRKRVNK